MSVTIKDLAKILGISSGTVSYALNGKGRVSNDLRRQIVQKAHELGYIPNRNARNLVKKVKGRIGLFIPDLEYLSSSIFFNNLLAGILSIIDNTENDLLVALSKEDFQNLLDGAMDVDGAIILHPRRDLTYYNLLNKLKVPFVIIGRPNIEFENQVSYVDVDNVAIAYNVTKMMTSKGHRKIVAVLGEKDFTITVDQTEGYKMGLSDANINFDERLIINKDFAIHSGMEEFKELYLNHKDISGIIVASDTQAVNLMNELRNLCLSVPKDISVGCLGGTYLTQYYNPSISGIINPSYEIGRKAAGKVINIIERITIRATHSIVDFSIHDGASIDYLDK